MAGKSDTFDSLLPQNLQLTPNNPIIANSAGNNYADAFYNLSVAPSLGEDAEQQYLGGNLGTNGESTFGSNFMSNAAVQGLENAQLTGQQYATQDINNLLNERNSFFGGDVATVQAQNNAAIQRALNLNSQDLQGQTAAAQAQLNTEQLNQQGQQQNYSDQLGALNQINSFNQNAGTNLLNLNQSNKQMQIQADAVAAAQNASLFGGATSLASGLLGSAFGSGSSFANGLSGSGLGSGISSSMYNFGNKIGNAFVGSSAGAGGINTGSGSVGSPLMSMHTQPLEF